ncbi:MAG: disulfide bond formation protein B [Deltaproteobacteria bacterium]
MSRRAWIILATLGSIALLGGAFVFQAFGYAPCKLCYWQRYPHAAAIGVGALALITGWRFWPWLGALAAAMTSGLGVYHTGVEQGWWVGPTSCTSGNLGQMTLNDIMAAPLVRCDEIAWALMGVSMASWNAILSAVLVAVWVKAALTRP